MYGVDVEMVVMMVLLYHHSRDYYTWIVARITRLVGLFGQFVILLGQNRRSSSRVGWPGNLK